MKDSEKIELKEYLELLEKYYLGTYKEKPIESFGLMSGFSGTILLQSIFLELTKNKKFEKEISENIDLLIKNIEEGSVSSPTFCTGLAGIGWLFQYLTERNIIETDIDAFLEELDLILAEEAENMIGKLDYDIMHGYLGLGLYFLKRSNYSMVEKIISSLKETGDRIGAEIAWKRFDGYSFNKYIYDFGLAHGNASILYFLGKCYQKKIKPEICETLITGIANFFIENIQIAETAGSFFPSVKSAESYKTIPETSFSRLAWCYGDLGILHTLLITSAWLNNNDLRQKVITLLEKLTVRKENALTSVADSFFCHGTSGIAYIYLNIYRITKKEIFIKAAEYWQSETIKYQKNKKVLTKSENDLNIQLLNQPDNLLNGIGGHALLFLSYWHENFDDRFNEMFFLL